MNCLIFSQKGNREFKNAETVVLPASNGEMEVLPGHAEAFVELKNGEITVGSGGGEKDTLPVSTGICHVSQDTVTVIF